MAGGRSGVGSGIFIGVMVMMIAAVGQPVSAAQRAGPAPEVSVSDVLAVPAPNERLLVVRIFFPGAVAPLGHTVAVDFTDVGGFTTASEPTEGGGYDCVMTPMRARCTLVRWEPPQENGSVLALWVTGKPGQRPGQRGTVTVVVAAEGLAPARAAGTVTLAEPVRLLGDDPMLTATGRPGDRLTLPLTVTNDGTVAVRGVVLVISADVGMDPASRRRNCGYSQGSTGRRLVACRFAETLQPGVSYRVAAPLPQRIGPQTWAPSTRTASLTWYTIADWALIRQSVTPMQPGTASPLRLAPDSPVSPASSERSRGVPQTEIGPGAYANIEVEVTGSNRADLAVTGARVPGGAGHTVTATVTVRNLGPATIDYGNRAEAIIEVFLPPGSTPIAGPAFCSDSLVDETMYRCRTREWFRPGDVDRLSFTFRLGQDAPTPGRVQVFLTEHNTPVPDLDPGNDQAFITVEQ
jgi:hypothetical protein